MEPKPIVETPKQVEDGTIFTFTFQVAGIIVNLELTSQRAALHQL